MENVFESIFEKAKKYYRDTNDLIHIKTASQLAMDIISKEGGNERIIIPAVILHDTGWHLFSYEEEKKARRITRKLDEIELTHKHEVESSCIAEKILSDINYPDDEKAQILRIITYHDTKTMPESKEDAIVKDADRLSRYTPECFEMFCNKLDKTKEEFFEILNLHIENWLHTDTAKFLSRIYLLKMRLNISENEFEKGIMKEFFEFLIRLEGEIINVAKGHFEKIAIMSVNEKVRDVKRMMEIYLISKGQNSLNLEDLQQDKMFISIATQKVCENGYIGVIDRETKEIIFHPDKSIINQPVEKLKKVYRPSEYLHHFWEWHERAYAGEEFYSYYQGINPDGEIIDKFQYVLPIDIMNMKWSLVAAVDSDDFFKPINILNTNIVQMIGKISEHLVEVNRQIEAAANKLIEAEKLSAITQIASEVAHEIKNPLQAIKTGVYFLSMVIPKENIDAVDVIQQVNNAVTRANGFITDLLNISRPIELKKNRLNINETIKLALNELPKDIVSDVCMILELSDNLIEIEADCMRLKQIIVNLVKNAIEEMGGLENKRLKISTQIEQGIVQISIEDTGRGIPKENLEKIFTPFYTTKGKGIGLGLAICKRFIDAHQWTIEVETWAGKGTRFVIKMSGG